MSTKDRNSSVPLGTFGASQPPPPPDAADAPAEAAEEPAPRDRPSTKSTLVGHPTPTGSVVPGMAPAPGAGSVAPTEPGRRSSVPNTLVGHPVPTDPGSAAAGPFLAPPKWQGASAYEGDDQPELQVGRGSRPSAPDPDALVDVPGVTDDAEGRLPDEGVSTASSVSVAGTQDAPAAEDAGSAAGDPNLDDSIQAMLDEQAAVPLEVEEGAGQDTELSASIELSASDIEIQGVLAAARAQAKTSKPPPTPAAASVRPAARRKQEEIADIPSGLSDPAVSLAPAEVASEPPDDSNPGLGILVLAAVAVIGVGGWLVTQGTYQRQPAPAPAPAATAPAPAPPAPTAPAPPAPAVAAPAAAAEGAPSESAPAEGKAAPTPVPASRRKPAKPPRQPAPRRASAPTSPPAAPAAPAPTAPTAQPEEPKLKPVNAYPTTKAAKPAMLPDRPSRDDVLAALEPIQAAVAACAKGQHGVAEVDITVQSSGQVSHAVVRGDFAGTPEGSCIARTVRGATFGPFTQPRFRVVYPFAL